jgi:hypothetical protein
MLDNIKFLAWQDYAGLNLNEKVKPKNKRKMKRQILFRGWSIEHQDWIEGYYVLSPKGQHRIYLQPFEGATSNTWFPVHPDSVGQFTGFSDMDSNNIFDEMRVLLDYPNREYIVRFHEGSFCLFHLPEFLDGAKWGALQRVFELGWNIKITGNTFNPDKA